MRTSASSRLGSNPPERPRGCLLGKEDCHDVSTEGSMTRSSDSRAVPMYRLAGTGESKRSQSLSPRAPTSPGKALTILEASGPAVQRAPLASAQLNADHGPGTEFLDSARDAGGSRSQGGSRC